VIFTVTEKYAGVRLDSYLAAVADVSRSAAVRAIEDGRVSVCGKAAEKKYAVRPGDCVSYEAEEVKEYEALAEEIPLDVIYEDDDIIVINKPSGMVVHPAHGNPSGTLVNALLHHCGDSLSGIGGVLRPGIVHRIDKDTSGLLVCAKNDFAHRALSAQLERHDIVREYHALVRGGFKDECGTVNLPIGRHPTDRKKMAVIRTPGAHAKEAVTHYEVLERFGQISHLKLLLETGRTHQIRVHMSHMGHPLLGDEVYGGGTTQFEKTHARLLSGQALHALKLTLTHPKTNELMTFESRLPEDFEALLRILRESV
jgi:23S rRNA pseudouridine1911/1915/1917 synthase